jgi:hypothetical protein
LRVWILAPRTEDFIGIREPKAMASDAEVAHAFQLFQIGQRTPFAEPILVTHGLLAWILTGRVEIGQKRAVGIARLAGAAVVFA